MSKKLILIILALPFIVIGGAYLLPNKTEVSRTVIIESDVQSVFDMVNNFKNAQSWSPWAEKDPNMEVNYEGPVSSGGARMTWKSKNPQVGSGSQEIIESKSLELVHIRLAFDGQEAADAFFKLEPQGDTQTQLTWSFVADHGEHPINRYLGLMFDTWVGSDYEKGLANLKALLENGEVAGDELAEEEPKEKVLMVDENGQVLELSAEEIKALNEKSAQQESPKISEDILKKIEANEKKKEAEQKSEAEFQEKINEAPKPKPVATGKENY